MNNSGKILNVTSPMLPELSDFSAKLEEIWQRRWITNNGSVHAELERALCDWLNVPFISLFTNGTLPLLTALQALDIRDGEVITTPYSFVATSHAIWWNGLKPVFADIDPETGNLDPNRVEDAITPATRAILPVHVYGTPCDTDAFDDIAKRHGLIIIYDAAHAFGVERDGKSILTEGDLSTLSFHATKVFNTVEGGAMVMKTQAMKNKIDHLKNFGFVDEVTVVAPGINSKLDEIRAAFGLLNLRKVQQAIDKRRALTVLYRDALRNVEGIRFFEDIPSVRHNYSYFPVFIDEKLYGMSRDKLYFAMQEQGVYGRRYFYPLISTFAPYRELESADRKNLPNAYDLAERVICLPLHQDMETDDVQRVLNILLRS